MAITPDGTGGWLLTGDGTVRAVGQAKHLGDRSGRLSAPAVEIASTPSGLGYYIATSAGEIFVFGDAVHAGHRPGVDTNITCMVPDPDGYGYTMFTADGRWIWFQEPHFDDPGYRRFPDANPRATPVVAVAAHPTLKGWHPVTAGGEILNYGDWGLGGGEPRPKMITAPIVDIAYTSTAEGYVLVDVTGHILWFGDATFHGHAHPDSPVVDIAMSPKNRGYWIATADGTILSFGDATDFG